MLYKRYCTFTPLKWAVKKEETAAMRSLVGLPPYPHGLKVRHHESQLLTKYVHENLHCKDMARFWDWNPSTCH